MRATQSMTMTVVMALCATSCAKHPSGELPAARAPLLETQPVPSPTGKASPSSSARALPPSAPSQLEWMSVEGFSPALVFAPADDGRPHPLAVVTHGAGGRPEPHCDIWRARLKERAFLLCTRGRSINAELPEPERGYFYDGHHELGKEVDRAVAALVAKYGGRVDVSKPIFTGFSQGASMGALWLHERSDASLKFARLVLVEGGSGQWNIALSEKAHRDGLEKVLLVCGQASCLATGRESVRYMKQGGIDARLEYATGAGHTDGGHVGERVEGDLAWLLEGDDRWFGSGK